MTLHEAVAGFDSGAEAYERGRPEYPHDAIAFLTEQLRLAPGAVVLDIGAGTGKLSRLLIKSDARVIGLEPTDGMRRKFAQVLPDTEVVGGVAESIPIRRGSLDAACAGQAFHWFANARALNEIHRVLKLRGRFAIIWNVRELTAEWIRDLWRIVEKHEGDVPRHRHGTWKPALEAFPQLRKIAERSFPFSQTGDVSMMLDRIGSISFIARLSDGARGKVYGEIRELLATHRETREYPQMELQYRTDAYIYERL
jgi:SAM-dependent methyltransferase